MIWALLFALILGASGSDLGDYTNLPNATHKEARQYVRDIVEDPVKEQKALDILKEMKKVGEKTERRINKHYVRLDKLEKKYDYDRTAVEEEIRSLMVTRRDFQDQVTLLWEDFKDQFTPGEWDLMRAAAEAKVEGNRLSRI